MAGARSQPSGTPREGISWADAAVWLVALTVLLGGLALVIAPLVPHGGRFLDDPYRARTVTETVSKESRGATGALIATERTTTRKEADESLVERAFADSGLLMLRLGLVFIAAFLAGAIVQRTMARQFGIEIGPVKVPQLVAAAEASTDAIDKLRGSVNEQLRTLQDRLAEGLTTRVEATDQLRTLAVAIAKAVDELEERVARIEPPAP